MKSKLSKVGTQGSQGVTIQSILFKHSMKLVGPMRATTPLLEKRVVYDELTMPQWVVGQLSNIFHMKDQVTARHALLQVILAMKDATSLPWTAVRSAWATSMHDLEEGNLGWQDATQWSLNRISASQISMATSQSITATQPRKICKYFNEGTCSHEASHNIYKHICSYCDRQGKTASHPEQKCFTKIKQKDKQLTS